MDAQPIQVLDQPVPVLVENQPMHILDGPWSDQYLNWSKPLCILVDLVTRMHNRSNTEVLCLKRLGLAGA